MAIGAIHVFMYKHCGGQRLREQGCIFIMTRCILCGFSPQQDGVKRRRHVSVFAITEMRDMGLYEVSLTMSLLGFGKWTMLANFHMCGIMLVKNSFQHARE